MEKYSRGDAVLASWRRFRSERRGLVKRLTRLSPEPPHPPFGHLLPAGEKGKAAISVEVTFDGKEGLAATPLLPRGEKVPEGRMRGLRAPTAPVISHHENSPARGPASVTRQVVRARKSCVARNV